MAEPYTEGVRARLTGLSATDNPHRKLSERWLDWADGWKDADEWDRQLSQIEAGPFPGEDDAGNIGIAPSTP